MKKYIILSLLLLSLLALPKQTTEADLHQSALREGDTTTITLRHGLAGYAGVSDTYLLNESPPGNYGSDTVLHVKQNSYAAKRTLIRFDLTAIPTHMEVTEATLELYVHYRYPDAASSITLYELLKPWSEGGATWSATGVGQDWALPGADGAGTDRSDVAVALPTLSAGNGYKSIDLTDLVNQWVQQPVTNHGLLIVGSSVDQRFWSSEDVREGERPQLHLTYRVSDAITPGPTLTLTPSPTPTQAPAATPTPANIVHSTGWTEAFDPTYPNCIEAGPLPSNPDNTTVLLVWRGLPTSASLSFHYAGNNRYRHSVLVNDTIIGQLPDIPSWAPVCSGDKFATLPFDASLVLNGENKISILDDGGPETSSWSLQAPKITLGGLVNATTIISKTLTSTYDGTEQRAMIQTPIGYQPGGADLPLVIALHGWGGRDFDALRWMAEAANDRGWLLAASDTRNSNQHTASKAVQHDILNLLDYMISSPEYSVDTDRVYLVGSSMGGMMAATIAAKYPDRFAALCELKGPTRLDSWYWEIETWRQNVIKAEINGTPANNPFAYQRKSAAAMPANLGNIPTLIIHGTEDDLVPYSHAEDLYAGIAPYGEVYLYPYAGGHYDDHPQWGPEAILTWFSQYQRNPVPEQVTVRTDEPKSYYWLDIDYVVADHWTWVDAAFDADTGTIEVDVHDERTNPTNVDVTFDLVAMGLPTHTNYTVEDSNLVSGYFSQSTVAASTHLKLSVLGDKHRLVAYPYAAQTPQEMTLRQGTAGYTGSADTYLSVYGDMDVNYAQADPMRLTVAGNQVMLLRFGLDPLPANVIIKSARLSLYSGSKWRTGDHLNTNIYRLLRPWQIDQVTWNQPQSGASWGQAGAAMPGEDYDQTVQASHALDATGVWYDYNVTELVRGWRTGAWDNHGMLVRSDAGVGTFTVSSSESNSSKPGLSIIYTYPTATPIPSPTAMPSARSVMLPVVLK